ncbi:hypothetical protein [Subtercola lobariae]|uniref:Transcriptional regulator n=1 Tax=Subtercola lobariae TaxID=1588641 RepID=A0A917B2C9_9MICO|nr:hypothetical protein [Subtercola lobariae]GGF15479.1 hypothetical protein GCM10011399_06600 [Subtercola lobariae]
MKRSDAVRRVLADAALQGRRTWANATDLAWEAGVAVPTAYKSIRPLIDIGAVWQRPGGGFTVLDPERVVTVLAADRTFRDAVATTSATEAEALAGSLPAYAVGGTRAAVHHLGGVNTVADPGQGILYIPEGADVSSLTEGTDVIVFTADAKALKAWRAGYTSIAQTYADLFAQPGWQASEFRRALWRKLFDVDDWSRAEALSGD